jgi:uncharacterized phage infection (PIP) family protein YhgE
LAQLKEDITIARENMFGRKIYEAVASEFAVTHLNENKEIAKLHQKIKDSEDKLAEATKAIDDANVIVETKSKEIRIIKESQERKETLTSLLKPLNKEKATVMSELLESVETTKLQSQFDKYLCTCEAHWLAVPSLLLCSKLGVTFQAPGMFAVH